tara:strand:+ start:139880 stop:141394 length:1515 start_codon:yes stop_codon:yes gene_type:complete
MRKQPIEKPAVRLGKSKPKALRARANFAARLIAVVILFAATRGYADEPIDIGSRRELFVDDLLIDRMDGVALRLHHPIKTTRPESPLPRVAYTTVIKDKDEMGVLFRAYWRGSDRSFTGERHTGHAGETVAYAESRDGHDWTFPKLGLHEVSGTRRNNVILANQPPLLTNFSPFIDTRPGVPRDERYKALAGYPGPGNKQGKAKPGIGLFAFYSADGIHWTKQGEVIPYQDKWRHAFDSQNVSFWSDAEQQYVCYFRTWTPEDKLRSISRTTSLDFQTWTKPIPMNPNRPGEHLYTNQTHPYFRAPHIYIALPTRYVMGRGEPSASIEKNNATDVLLMTSRAGNTHYDRTFQDVFIRPGLDASAWTNRANYVALNVVPTSPTEMSIYHRSGDRYTLRIDGFASAHASFKTGELLTRPVTFAGDSLHINFSTSAAGSVRVELQRPNGSVIPGFSLNESDLIFGDEIDREVRWAGSTLTSIAGQPVRLRFIMQECDLYSFQFPNSE